MFLTSVSSRMILERWTSLRFGEELLICSMSLSCRRKVLRYSETKLYLLTALGFRLNPFVPPEVWVSLFTVSSHVWSTGTLPKGLLLLSWTENPPELTYLNASGSAPREDGTWCNWYYHKRSTMAQFLWEKVGALISFPPQSLLSVPVALQSCQHTTSRTSKAFRYYDEGGVTTTETTARPLEIRDFSWHPWTPVHT